MFLLHAKRSKAIWKDQQEPVGSMECPQCLNYDKRDITGLYAGFCSAPGRKHAYLLFINLWKITQGWVEQVHSWVESMYPTPRETCISWIKHRVWIEKSALSTQHQYHKYTTDCLTDFWQKNNEGNFFGGITVWAINLQPITMTQCCINISFRSYWW